MIRLTYMNDALSDAAFIGFQLIVTHGLCKKTCLDWHVTERVLANSCHSACNQSSLVKENTIYAQTGFSSGWSPLVTVVRTISYLKLNQFSSPISFHSVWGSALPRPCAPI